MANEAWKDIVEASQSEKEDAASNAYRHDLQWSEHLAQERQVYFRDAASAQFRDEARPIAELIGPLDDPKLVAEYDGYVNDDECGVERLIEVTLRDSEDNQCNWLFDADQFARRGLDFVGCKIKCRIFEVDRGSIVTIDPVGSGGQDDVSVLELSLEDMDRLEDFE